MCSLQLLLATQGQESSYQPIHSHTAPRCQTGELPTTIISPNYVFMTFSLTLNVILARESIMSTQFADRQDAIEFLGTTLAARILISQAVGKDLAANIVDDFAVSAEEDSSNGRRAVFAPARWVIRNQDLDLVNTIGSILQGTATAGTLLHAANAVGAGMIAPALLIATYVSKLVINLYKRGVTLSDFEYRALCAIRESNQGLTADQLANALKRAGIDASPENTQHVLNRLSQYPAASEDISLVWRSHDDHWHTKDV
jgi:hypothetical protein